MPAGDPGRCGDGAELPGLPGDGPDAGFGPCPGFPPTWGAVSGTAVAYAASNSAIAWRFASGNGTGVGMASPTASNPFSLAVYEI